VLAAQHQFGGLFRQGDLAEGGAAEGLGDGLADRGFGQPGAGGFLAVDAHLDAGGAGFQVGGDVPQLAHAGHRGAHGFGGGGEGVAVGGLHDDLDDVGGHAAALLDAHGDLADAGARGDLLAQPFGQFGRVDAGRDGDGVGGEGG